MKKSTRVEYNDSISVLYNIINNAKITELDFMEIFSVYLMDKKLNNILMVGI